MTVTYVKQRIMGKEKIGRGRGDSNSVYIHFYTNPYPQNKRKKKNDLIKQHRTSYQTGELEKNCKMFANPVFIAPCIIIRR